LQLRSEREPGDFIGHMIARGNLAPMAAIALLSLVSAALVSAATFRVATYNLNNYLDQPAAGRPAKTAEAKAVIRKSILALKPDVLAIQEIGSLPALLELKSSLRTDGLDLPFQEHVSGFDTNIHVAVLSRFPFAARHPHTNDYFLLNGRRFRVSRGFGEVDIEVSSNCTFTLIIAHLKSRRPVPVEDEAALRLEEAKILREKIDARLASNPGVKLLVAGDLNDTPDSAPVRLIVGDGSNTLLDTSPAVSSAAQVSTVLAPTEPGNWTHHYPKANSYSRIDYLLLSPGMARAWVPNESYVLALPDWEIGSDHRPVVATFSY
jgi:endonuclease/exonuclease/phosphatase family metal-dependent hydrolase